jgi:hypothetical protein
MAWPIPQPQQELNPANLKTQTEVAWLEVSIENRTIKARLQTICSKNLIHILLFASY